jgi:hypothetical protein
MSASDLFHLFLNATPFVIGYGVVLGPFLIIGWWRLRRRRRLIEASKAQGTIADIGGIFAQKLPSHYAALASMGTAGAAPMTVDDRILRPSPGLQLFILGLTTAIAAFTLFPQLAPDGFHEAMAELPGPTLVPKVMMLAALANALIYVFGNEARYNRDTLISTRMAFHRREYRWKDLEWIGDTGAYDLVLMFGQGGKAKVLKHCKGIEDFKMFAQDQIRKNRAAGA